MRSHRLRGPQGERDRLGTAGTCADRPHSLLGAAVLVRLRPVLCVTCANFDAQRPADARCAAETQRPSPKKKRHLGALERSPSLAGSPSNKRQSAAAASVASPATMPRRVVARSDPSLAREVGGHRIQAVCVRVCGCRAHLAPVRDGALRLTRSCAALCCFSATPDGYRVCGKGQGDTYGAGVNKRKASNCGRSDKASRERARREKKRKDEKRDDRRMRDFERRALAEPHPQMCPICLTELVTHLVLTCGAGPPHYHRGHGYCEDCATNVVVPSGPESARFAKGRCRAALRWGRRSLPIREQGPGRKRERDTRCDSRLTQFR